MEDTRTPDTDIGWYVSDTHARRAIGYLSAALPELHSVDMPCIAKAWGDALLATIDPNERSPIGPEVTRPPERMLSFEETA
jgi:hypothetical protein